MPSCALKVSVHMISYCHFSRQERLLAAHRFKITSPAPMSSRVRYLPLRTFPRLTEHFQSGIEASSGRTVARGFNADEIIQKCPCAWRTPELATCEHDVQGS